MTGRATTGLAVAAGHATATHHGFFDGFGWNEAATIIAAIAAAAIAASIAVLGYGHQRRAERRAERATLYARAIAVVEDYLEGPYRIRRKDGTNETRHAITSAISDVKSAISLHQGLLELHAPATVSSAYNAFVTAGIAEAGPQMTAAWRANATTSDAQVPLGVGYDRSDSDQKRADLVAAMTADLRRFD
jgi:hypothetical protein